MHSVQAQDKGSRLKQDVMRTVTLDVIKRVEGGGAAAAMVAQTVRGL